MTKVLIRLAPVALLAVPLVAGAAPINNFRDVIVVLRDLIAQVIPFIIALAGLIFIWGVLQYVMAGGDATKQKEARDKMLWGVIAIFVMLSFWGLVNLLSGTFQLNTAVPTNLPQVPTIP